MLHSLYLKNPRPHLDCSGKSKTRFDLMSVHNETRSITFNYNGLVEFYIDDLARFPNLQKIQFRTNKLTRLVPSSQNLRLEKVMYLFLK